MADVPDSSLFSFGEEDILLECVQNYPFIFRTRDKKYKDSGAKACAWKEIAETLGKTEDACRTKWKNMRDWYTRKVKDGKLPTGSGASAVRIRSRFEHMSFLDGTLVSQRTLNSVADPGDVDDSSTSGDELAIDPKNSEPVDSKTIQDAHVIHPTTSLKSNVKPAKRLMRTPEDRKPKTVPQQILRQHSKRSRERLERVRDFAFQDAERDEFDGFFSSMASSARQLPRHLQISVKRDISNIMFEAENQALCEAGRVNYPSSSTSPEGSSIHDRISPMFCEDSMEPQ